MFGILTGVAMSSLNGAPSWFGDTTLTAGLIVPIIVIGGLVLGFATGFGLFLLKKAHWLVYLIVLSTLCFTYIFVTMHYSLSGLAYIALVLSCLISIKSREISEVRKIGKVMVFAWRIVEVILFGLIGAAMDINKLNGNTVAYAVLAVFLGELIKVPVAFLTTITGNFNMKERIFMTLCRMPKATVQASLGGAILSIAQAAGDSTFESYGEEVLTTAATSIMITTPIALVISSLAPYLLTQASPSSMPTVGTLSPIIEVKEGKQTSEVKEEELVQPINSPDDHDHDN